MKTNALITIVLGSTLFASCVTEKKNDVAFNRVSSFRVEITSGAVGSAASPLAYTPAGSPYTLSVTAIGPMGETMTDYDGTVKVTAEPGKITGPALTLNNGTGSATVTLERAFGVTRIWVEDPETYATGVTEAIHFRGPRIADVQTSTSAVASPFEGERVPIDVQSELVVVGIERAGFYVVDTGVAGGNWAAIYAFTFSAPQGLSVGDKITNLTGRVSEFLGFTELNNPSWEVVGTLPLPAPKQITCTELNAGTPNLTMEQFEAGLIELNNATVEICPSYPNCPDYDEYRQWSINLGSCSINAITRYSIGGFDPLANEGKQLTKVVGTMRHIQFAQPQWIIEPRGAADVCCPTCTPALNQGC